MLKAKVQMLIKHSVILCVLIKENITLLIYRLLQTLSGLGMQEISYGWSWLPQLSCASAKAA